MLLTNIEICHCTSNIIKFSMTAEQAIQAENVTENRFHLTSDLHLNQGTVLPE